MSLVISFKPGRRAMIVDLKRAGLSDAPTTPSWNFAPISSYHAARPMSIEENARAGAPQSVIFGRAAGLRGGAFCGFGVWMETVTTGGHIMYNIYMRPLAGHTALRFFRGHGRRRRAGKKPEIPALRFRLEMKQPIVSSQGCLPGKDKKCGPPLDIFAVKH